MLTVSIIQKIQIYGCIELVLNKLARSIRPTPHNGEAFAVRVNDAEKPAQPKKERTTMV